MTRKWLLDREGAPEWLVGFELPEIDLSCVDNLKCKGVSPALREALAAPHRGKPKSAEHKKRISESRKGNGGPRGHKQTPEHRAKLAEATRARYAARRAAKNA